MANKKFSELTEVTTPNSESIFATAYDGDNFKVTLTNIAANMPSITTTGTVTATTFIGNVTGNVTGSVTGNADTATALATGRTIGMTGDVTWTSSSFDGTGDVTGTASIGTGVIVDADVNASAAIDASKIHDGTVSNTEFGYLNGVSSAIQTQLDTKLANVVEDTTPQLGGDLDVNSNAIVGTSVGINASNGDLMITATQDGPVALRYDGNLKLSTKSDGVNITGELEADSLDIDGNADITGTLNTHTIPGGTGTFALTSDLTFTASSTDTLTNKTFDANGTGNSLSNVEVADLASGVLDTDLSTVSASDDTLASAKAIKTYVDSQVTAQDLDFQADTGGALSIDLDSETLTFTGGTGIDTSGSGNAVTFAIDSTVATLSGTQTLTNKTINSASNTITITESNISDLGAYITASSTDTLTNKSGSNSQWTNDAGYITASSTDTLTNKSGNISQWTNDSSYLTGNQTITLSGDASGSGTTAITVTVADDSHNHIISNVDGLQTALDGKVVETASTGSAEIPAGTTGERDGTPSAGYLRFNTTDSSFEGYDGSAWGSIGGGASAGGAIYENTDDITSDYTITSGSNGFSVGPMTIASGVTVTVPSGQRWVIL